MKEQNMQKIFFSEKKVLKLSNALICNINLNNSNSVCEIDAQIEKMKNYITVKGSKQVGPLIQYNKITLNENNEPQIDMQLILQCASFIHNVEKPYNMKSIIKVSDCMYCRYNGPEDKLKFAHDKILLEAFEREVNLKGDSYTIFVDENVDSETIIADVFMERVN